jgi:hypothetical protein
MRSLSRAALVVSLLTLTAAGASWRDGQVAPGQMPPPSPPAAGTGFIAGQVVDAVTGKPVPEATVMINGRGAPAGRGGAPAQGPQPVIADAQGRFFFSSLTAGLYIAQVGKTGYLSATAGPLELGDGDRVTDWRVKLAKLASVSGTLRDETGDPVVGTDVFVVRRTVVNGRQSWQSAGRGRSDDRGVYRVGGLQAGDYLVCACSRDPIPVDAGLLTTLAAEPLQLLNVAARALSVGSDVVSLDSTLRTYAPAFYPNSATIARASRVAVAPGDEKTGIDIQVPLVRATRVSGAVVGAQGPVLAQSMRLVPDADAEAGAALFTLQPMLVQPDGRFDFATVPPGQYRLVVVHRPNLPMSGPSGAAMAFVGSRGAPLPPAGATMSSGGPATLDPPWWASQPVTVGENGVGGLVVALNRALAVTGRVQWIGGAPQPPAQMLNRATIILQPVSMADPLASMGGSPVGRFSPDATFAAPGALPGKYTITANVLPGFPTLKSVTVGGMDITDLPLEIGDKDVGDVVLTYLDTPMASLTVTVAPAAGGTPAGDQPSILVFPADRKYWTEPAAARRRFRQVAPTPKNVVTLGDLPGGDYLALVASALEAADWMEPVKLEALSRRAQRVTVPDTGKASVEVRR